MSFACRRSDWTVTAHVVLGNGLDLTHVVPVHRFRFFVDDPVVEPMRRTASRVACARASIRR